MSKETIKLVIDRHTEGDIILYTDDYTIYCGVDRHEGVVLHGVVRHSDGGHAVDDVHIVFRKINAK